MKKIFSAAFLMALLGIAPVTIVDSLSDLMSVSEMSLALFFFPLPIVIPFVYGYIIYKRGELTTTLVAFCTGVLYFMFGNLFVAAITQFSLMISGRENFIGAIKGIAEDMWVLSGGDYFGFSFALVTFLLVSALLLIPLHVFPTLLRKLNHS